MVWTREILHTLEIFGYSSQRSIKHRFLYSIRPLRLTGSHQIIADSPCIVANITGFMTGKRIITCQSLRTGVHTIGKHIRLFHLIVGIKCSLQILILARILIKQHRNFHQFVHCNTVHMEVFVIQTAFLCQLRTVLSPRILGKSQQFRVLCDGISPQNTFHIHDKTISAQLLNTI